MPRRCIVPTCTSNYFKRDGNGNYVTVFMFPKDPVEKAKWLSLIPGEINNFNENSVICIRHFEPDVVITEDEIEMPNGTTLKVPRNVTKLKDGAFPSVFKETDERPPNIEPKAVPRAAGKRRRYKDLTMEEKKEILKHVNKNELSVGEIAEAFNIKPAAVGCVVKLQQKRTRVKKKTPPYAPDVLENTLLTWFNKMNTDDYRVSPSLVLAKAKLIAHEMRIGAKIDRLWVQRFKKKYNLQFRETLVVKPRIPAIESSKAKAAIRNSPEKKSPLVTRSPVAHSDEIEDENMSFETAAEMLPSFSPSFLSALNKTLTKNDSSPSLSSSSSSSSSSSHSTNTDSDSSENYDSNETNKQQTRMQPKSKSKTNLKRTCGICGKVNYKSLFFGKDKLFCTKRCFFASKRPKNSKNISPLKSDPSVPDAPRKPSSEDLGSFDWKTYLARRQFHAAPVSCFKHVALSDSWDQIIVGLKLEVISPDWPKYKNCLPKFYWLASVQETAGFMAHLRYEGYEKDGSHDFWINMCIDEVHEAGWCASSGHVLIPPKSIEQKHADWKKYLCETMITARTIPPDFALKVKESFENNIKLGMRLEVVDKNRISCVRVATVIEVVGGRLHLTYDDSDVQADDFWCHERSPLIHPVGWAQVIGHNLFATKEYARKSFEKTIYSHVPFDPNDATWDMFLPVLNPVNDLEFEEGMKLEAIDPLNLSTICVATVTEVLRNNYLMIGIDGMMAANGSDWFCYHASSPCIFPVGFCASHGIKLTPPRGYKGPFDWDEYLKQTKSSAAPVGLFKRDIPDHGFAEGMYLEAVDLMEPRLICVSSVTKVVGRLLRIHFDGWEDDYDQWCDCESPDLYPIGWCNIVEYRLEPPRSNANEDLTKKKKKFHPYKGGNRKKKRVTWLGKRASEAASSSPLKKLRGSFANKTRKISTDTSMSISPDKTSQNLTHGSESSQKRKDPPNMWNTSDVVDFLKVSNCDPYCQLFEDEKIDGQQFLDMTKEKLMKLGMKIGPALKIVNLIQQLKRKQ